MSQSSSLIDQYEYMNENEINQDIKCIICIQPYQFPVSLPCRHTFCEVCIKKWIQTQSSCPICRLSCGTTPVLRQLTNANIYYQLNNLRV